MSPDASRRIISVLPAATETVYALGAGDELVAVSHECDHPEAARDLPKITRSRIDAKAPSAAIDAKVKEAARAGRSLYEIDEPLLRKLAPTHVLAQIECDVCALTPKDLDASLRSLPQTPEVVRLEANSLEGVLRDTRILGEALGREDEAKEVLLRQWRVIKQVRARVQGLARPRVLVLDWVDPPMLAGHWVPDLVQIAGGTYEAVKSGEKSRWTSWDEIEEAEPDVIVAAPCGRSLAQTRADLAAGLARLSPGDVRAMDEGHVWIADGNAFFNRPGPRLVYSAAILARTLHPDAVPALPPALESSFANYRSE